MAKGLWVEKYRPTSIADYVFRDSQQKQQITNWVTEKEFPNILLYGPAGTGKTSLAKVLVKEVGIDEYDFLEINASRTNSVDDVRDTITNFVSMIPFGGFKVVLLDEADFLSTNGQAALRGLIEEYHTTARFILTCNYQNRIIPALHSRCQTFHIEKLDHTEYTARAATILVSENIDFDLATLDTYVKAAYPDLRKCINLLQQHSYNNKLHIPDTHETQGADYKPAMVELFKAGKIREARKLICSSAKTEEFSEIYVWLYQNIQLFGKDEDTQDSAVLIIKQGLVEHAVCADAEICISATLIKLARLVK